jgi:hypothetical protein
MPVRATRVIHCVCCGLRQRGRVDGDADPGGAARCLRCAGHSPATGGDTLETYAAREADHAQLYRQALTEAQDDTVLARSEADFCRDRMQAAYATREMLVKVLADLDGAHHLRGGRCVCGKRRCRVVDVLSDPRVARLIRGYDEEQRTLRELRNANPDLWADAWDFIDVTLVYPKAERQAGGGRHRARG